VADVYDRLMAHVPYGWWVDYAGRLWRSAGADPRRILDLACGTGNVTAELLRRGYEVEGADASPAMLAVARRKLPAAVALHCRDMRDLPLPGPPFDACVCLFDSLNYLLTPEDLARACAGVAAGLRPGGVFVFDMNAIHALETGMFNQSGSGDGGLEYEWHSGWDPVSRLCTIHMEFRLRDGAAWSTLHETHVQRGYPVAEIRAALEGAGFTGIEVFQAFTMNAPNARTDRYHFLARKAAAGSR
jgi:SAM-dependent methyltransferase